MALERDDGVAVAVIGSAVCLSAGLLFTAEPLVGRLTLPVFGGGPGVWAVVLVFFQSILLLGYLYGHLSVTRLGLRRGVIVHAVLFGLAGVALALAPTRPAELRRQGVPPELDMLVALALLVGPAAFVLTATTPLLSAWHAATSRPGTGGANPYWLYALSNLGSFGGLLAYPFLIEQRLGLAGQRAAWAGAFVVLGVLLLGCGLLVLARTEGVGGRQADRPVRDALDAESAAGVSRDVVSPAVVGDIERRRRLRWVLLAAVPSGLMTAVTNVIATDLISAPLLWIGPLAIYLLTFVVAFSRGGAGIVRGAIRLAPVALTLLWIPLGSVGAWPIVPLLALEFGAFAVTALALHGRLALDRPPVERITEFYLVLAVGGVIGGSFVALLAPVVFPAIWEYPILVVMGLALLARDPREGPANGERARRRLDLRPFFAGAPGRLLPYLAAAVPLGVAVGAGGGFGLEAALRWLVVGGLVLLVGGEARFLTVGTALVLLLGAFVIPQGVLFQGRSFFGVSEVIRWPGSDRTVLMNGTTVHGVQSTDPQGRLEPLSYYTRTGPIGDVVGMVRAVAARPVSIGVVGLGAGAMAAYARGGASMTFYEIDPVVVRLASDPRFFTFLADAPTRPSIVLGDARLSLERVRAGLHDLLVLDAFSSDSIPVHLLTAEAFGTYERVVGAGGVLAVHLSNRYYDLVAPVAAAAQARGLRPLVRYFEPTSAEVGAGAAPSVWVAATSDPTVLARLAASGWRAADPAPRPFTDDFSDLLHYLRAGP